MTFKITNKYSFLFTSIIYVLLLSISNAQELVQDNIKSSQTLTDLEIETQQDMRKPDSPLPGQSAKLKIIEQKVSNGEYKYKFILENDSTSLFLNKPFGSDSEGSKRGKNIIWNWGLITGDKEIANSITCPSKNDIDKAYYHFYMKKKVTSKKDSLFCAKWIRNDNDTSPLMIEEKTKKIYNFITPKFAKKFILKSEGFNESDGTTIGFVWFGEKSKWVSTGEKIKGFGFTLKKPLDKKKLKFWTFYKTEFTNKSIEFIKK